MPVSTKSSCGQRRVVLAQRVDTLDLDSLKLRAGEGTRLDVEVHVAPLELSGGRYEVVSGNVEVRVDVSHTTSGFAFRLAFEAPLAGPCMRCLGDARPVVEVEVREVDQPGDTEELRSPYLERGQLELSAWVRDALVLSLPSRLVCREDCRGLCAVCGQDLNQVDPGEHRHEGGDDPRWAALRKLKLE